MAFFDVKSKKKNNSHPVIKVALRKWIITKFTSDAFVLDVYGAKGMMYKKIWNHFDYTPSEGDAIKFLNNCDCFNQDIFDVDPYGSPYEALKIITSKSKKDRIGIVCTDGTLRRAGMMRSKIPKFLQAECGWPERDLTLLAGIYNQYPSFLRHALNCVCNGYSIEKLAVKYGIGTWKQATCYYAAVLVR